MPNQIRIKRRLSGGAAGSPSGLLNAELAFNETDNTLYYGFGDAGGGVASSVSAIAGSGAFVALTGSQSIAGTKTVTGAISVTGTLDYTETLTTAENSTKVATTRWVTAKVSTLGGGTVTSVGLSLPNIFTVTGSPVTSTGNLTATLASQTAAFVFAAPTGAAGSPTFRALAVTDIPTLTASKISDFDTQVRTSRRDQLSVPLADVNNNSYKIINLADPVNAQDAATKNYVDTSLQGLKPKQSVRAASTANIASLSGPQTIDGISLVAGDRVLVKDQTTSAGNGIYLVASGAWTRTTDADTWAEIVSAYVFVEAGTTNADIGYVFTVDQGGTINATNITVVQFTGAGQITVNAPLSKTGNVISLGTVTVPFGGTGATTLTGFVYGNGAAAMTAVATIPIANGGTGATTAPLALSGLGAAARGANSDITSITGLTTALTVAQGGTGATTITGLVKGTGTSAFTAATAGTDYLAPSSTIDGGTF
ncbi:hypothetical protein UFOVP184_38 [uncultured Caudovirales phage]|uniref:Major tropism determinant N-terminal domain-containing protein n=1 Tax=uncultured Caudovirales phage TaxID=2100421 RepID=A0A6J7WGP5_9CAUD|nr:hypothetical protein UFOVP184_38 [uncultured Caudovirales phage]